MRLRYCNKRWKDAFSKSWLIYWTFWKKNSMSDFTTFLSAWIIFQNTTTPAWVQFLATLSIFTYFTKSLYTVLTYTDFCIQRLYVVKKKKKDLKLCVSSYCFIMTLIKCTNFLCYSLKYNNLHLCLYFCMRGYINCY